MIRFDANGKVDRRETHIRTITAKEAVKDYDRLADALDLAVAALRRVMNEETIYRDDCQRWATDALRAIGAITPDDEK